jgi:hypothetical protein
VARKNPPIRLDAVEQAYQHILALRALREGTGHLHLVCWSQASGYHQRWALVTKPRSNAALCGTLRCIPLKWNQPLFEPDGKRGKGCGIEMPGWVSDGLAAPE